MKKSAEQDQSASPDFLPAQKANLTSAIGRNSLYNHDYPVQAFKLCLLGATNKELAAYFDVSPLTISNWKNFHSAFNDAVTRGKKMADMEVAHSLYQATLDRVITLRQAIKCKEVYYDDNGKRVEKERIEVINVEKHIPACFRSQQFWLRNRNPSHWGLKIDDSADPAPVITLDLGSGHNPLFDETAG
jgi:hypothetical protein